MSIRKISISDDRERSAVVALEGCRIMRAPRYQDGLGCMVHHVRLVKTDISVHHDVRVTMQHLLTVRQR